MLSQVISGDEESLSNQFEVIRVFLKLDGGGKKAIRIIDRGIKKFLDELFFKTFNSKISNDKKLDNSYCIFNVKITALLIMLNLSIQLKQISYYSKVFIIDPCEGASGWKNGYNYTFHFPL